MNGYLSFILAHRRFLAFGLLMTFFSSFGQTFFIALFGAKIRADFQLSHGGFGTIYSLATLTSAACLIWLGRRIDDLDLRLFSSLVCLGLAAGCLTMAVAGHPLLLFAALLLLRLMGQGLLSHTAATSMGRYFDRQRGKAIGIASLGHAGGEALLPLPAVLLMGALGWRQSWLLTGIVLALGLVPLVLWLLKGHGERHRRLLEEQGTGDDTGRTRTRRHWTRREVLGDRWFYRVLPAVLASPLIMTGLFFHQAHLAEVKGWSLTWVATCFVGFAVSSVGGSLVGGVLVDRLGAVRLLPVYLLPLACALVLLALLDHPGAALGYLALAGLSAGLNFSVSGSLWAEAYGVLHLGAIRALLAALMVFSTALSPVVLGALIDLGVSMEAIAGLCLTYVALAITLVALPGGRVV
ncbi:MAG: MFS transporter [Candidatus Competibacteraceae bacterium]|nr:MFS transporter [Candidatus Competibacteraceae bacterium]